MKTLTLSEESVPTGACDQISTDCNLRALIGTCVDVVSVTCIINDRDIANLLALAIGVEVKAMTSNPRRKNRVKLCVVKSRSGHVTRSRLTV